MSDANDLLKTQEELKNYLQLNKSIKQAEMLPTPSFLIPNISKSLGKSHPTNTSARLWDQLQFLIAKVTKQTEWPELVAKVPMSVNIETLIINSRTQEESNQSKRKLSFSNSDLISLASLFMTLCTNATDESTRNSLIAILLILFVIIRQRTNNE
jgi:hypothetical protein